VWQNTSSVGLVTTARCAPVRQQLRPNSSAAREVVFRALRSLVASKLIATNRTQITIIDAIALGRLDD
jgi:hypothetical protein